MKNKDSYGLSGEVSFLTHIGKKEMALLTVLAQNHLDFMASYDVVDDTTVAFHITIADPMGRAEEGD